MEHSHSKPKNRWVFIAGIIALILGVSGYFIPVAVQEGTPQRIYLDNSGGPVLFTHQKHTQPFEYKCKEGEHIKVKTLECSSCHHELIKANDVLNCAKCHQDEGYSPEDMEHSELIDVHPPDCALCHQSSGDASKVQSCRICHQEKGEAEPVSCDRCHEGEGYSPEDLSHDELEAIEGHWCTECHNARRRVDAIHTQCSRCHNKLKCGKYFPEPQVDHEAVTCDVCHLKHH